MPSTACTNPTFFWKMIPRVTGNCFSSPTTLISGVRFSSTFAAAFSFTSMLIRASSRADFYLRREDPTLLFDGEVTRRCVAVFLFHELGHIGLAHVHHVRAAWVKRA